MQTETSQPNAARRARIIAECCRGLPEPLRDVVANADTGSLAYGQLCAELGLPLTIAPYQPPSFLGPFDRHPTNNRAETKFTSTGTRVNIPQTLNRTGEDFRTDDRRMIAVAVDANPRLPSTPSHARFAMLMGHRMTVGSFLVRVGEWRGRRDLREWTRAGEVVVS